MILENSYVWYDSIGKFPEFEGETESDDRDIQWHMAICDLGNPLPSIDEWNAPNIKLVKKCTKKIEFADCINSSVIEFVSEHAKIVLNDYFRNSRVKLYPVNIIGTSEKFYMVVPALYEEGENMDIFYIDDKLPYKKNVTKKFIDAVEKNGLTGFCFKGADGDAFYVNKNLTKKKKASEQKQVSLPNPINWVNQVKKLAENQDWHRLSDVNNGIMQKLIDSGDMISMLNFYDEALKSVSTDEQLLKIKPTEMSAFNQILSDAFTQAHEKFKADRGLKSIYCEYFYDGGDSCELNLFLCEKHPDEDESWAAYFGEEGFIEGPEVNQFLDYDPEFDFEPALDSIAKQYVQAHFIRSCLKIINENEINNIPIGFAEHDGMIVMLKR